MSKGGEEKESHTKIRWLDNLDQRELRIIPFDTSETEQDQIERGHECSAPDGKFSSKMEDPIYEVETIFSHERCPWYCK